MLSVTVKGTLGVVTTLNARLSSVKEKMDTFVKRLAEIGMENAQVHYSEAAITEMVKATGDLVTHTPNITVSVVPSNNLGGGYAVLAEGREVAFVEFGAGVYYNESQSYPYSLPDGIVGIGQYGHGRGNNPAWYFKSGGEVMRTHGNPATPALYYASEEMYRQVARIAKEVFG